MGRTHRADMIQATHWDPPLAQDTGTYVMVTQSYQCPAFFVNGLQHLAHALADEDENFRGDFSPFVENGETYYCNDVFEVEAYYYDEDMPQEFNFKYGDIMVSWEKRLGHNTTVNRAITEMQAQEIIRECIKSVQEDYS